MIRCSRWESFVVAVVVIVVVKLVVVKLGSANKESQAAAR
jgi:hypothetical protein